MGNIYLATLTDEQMLQILVAILGLTGMILFLALFIFIIQIFARWRTFAKMGVASWKALIPIYSDYCLWGGVWSSKMYIIDIVIGGVSYAIAEYVEKRVKANPNDINALLIILLLVCLVMVVILIVFQVKYVRRYSKAFGHGAGYALGLFFLPSLFELIIGFGASQYVGNQSETFVKPKE